MDPITIVSTSAALAVTCVRLSGYIYTIVDKVRTVDNAVRVLGVEIESLSHVLRAISTSFDDQSLAKAALSAHTGHEVHHWENVRRSMGDCKETLTRLECVFEKLNKGDSLSGFLWRPSKKTIKFNMKAETISLLKQEIECYRQTMQLSLQLISVSSGMNNEALTATLSSKLDELTVDIQKIAQSLADQSKSSVPEIIQSPGNSNLEACVQSAGKIVSSAAGIVYERSVRGSETGDSVLGDNLSADKRRVIEAWIPENVIVEEPGEFLPASLTTISIDGTSSSEASDEIFSPTGTSYTGLTSPASEHSKFRFDYGTFAEHRIHKINNVEEEATALKLRTSPPLHLAVNAGERKYGTGSVTFGPTAPRAKINTDLDIVSEDRAAAFTGVLAIPVTGANTEDDFLNDLRKRAMVKFEQKEYAAAESLLEKTLKDSQEKYGTDFPGKERTLRLLATACAHQGLKERVHEILDEGYPQPAVWKHEVITALITSLLEEGKVKQASETLERYGTEFEGRQAALESLVSICLKHRAWLVAMDISTKYTWFEGRKSMLETFATACRQESSWSEAEAFLLELLKTQTQNDIEWSATMHVLAEVYLAKNDLNSARDYCRKAFDVRWKKLGKNNPIFLESTYLLAKIIYEAKGDQHEFELYRDKLPKKVQECLELELLSRMQPGEASRQLGNHLLKGLNKSRSGGTLHVDLDSVIKTMKFHDVVGTTVRNGDTLLHLFAASGNEKAIQQLIDAGARVSTLSTLGYTPLYLAIAGGHEPASDVLLKNGTTVDGRDSVQDPLFLAATNGQIRSVRLLLKYRTGRGQWPAPLMLYQTAANGHVDVLQLLLENGAKDVQSVGEDHSAYFRTPPPPPRCRTALHEAAAHGFPPGIVELLINTDNIKTIDLKGKTPLHEAVLGQCASTVEILLKYGVKVHGAESNVTLSLQRGPNTFEEIISPATTTKATEARAPYVDVLDNSGSTALHLAMFSEQEPNPAIVALLLKNDAKVNGTERLTKRALVEAVLRQTEDSSAIVHQLLEYKADISGLRELGYNFQDYEKSVGSTTAGEIIRRLSIPQRRNTESFEHATGRAVGPKVSWFNSKRKPTACTYPMSS